MLNTCKLPYCWPHIPVLTTASLDGFSSKCFPCSILVHVRCRRKLVSPSDQLFWNQFGIGFSSSLTPPPLTENLITESRLFHGVYGDIPDGQDTVDASCDRASQRNLRLSHEHTTPPPPRPDLHVLSVTRQVRTHVAYRCLTLGPSLH